jgi:hypothetical protein
MKDNFSDLESKKGETCISLVLPFYQQGKPIEENPVLVRNGVKEIKKLLREKQGMDEEKLKALESALDNLSQSIDYMHRAEGIGLFVSPSVSRKFLFEFPVKKLMVVNDHFDIRPMLLEEAHTAPFVSLLITANKARLYEGMGKKLKEVFQKDFPKDFVDSFEYPKPGLGNLEGAGLKGSEEKAVTRENRLREFFSGINTDLKIHTGKHVPLFVCGLADIISVFKKVSDLKIAGILPGNYEYDSIQVLGEKIYKEVLNYRHEKINSTINELREAGGPGFVSTGVEGVWDEVFQANARILLVDKDVQIPGWQTEDKSSVSLVHDSKHTHRLEDAIAELIWLAREKGCEVLFTESGELDAFDKVAVLHRYKEEMA